METVKVLLALAALLQLSVALPNDVPTIDITRYFEASASSTCGEQGDTPTLYEEQGNTVVFANCSSGEHVAALMLDGDPDTYWQSEIGVTPVELTFALQQPSYSLELVGLRLSAPTLPPVVLVVEVLPAGGESVYTPTQVYVYGSNDSDACRGYEAQGVPCTTEYGIEDGKVIVCSLNSSLPATQQPIVGFRLNIQGFQDSLGGLQQYFRIVEVEILGWVAEGYYVPSFHAISVEGEVGTVMDPQGVTPPFPLPTAGEDLEFPGFTGRGYAVLQYSDSDRATVQWIFPSLRKASTYQLVLRYRNLDSTRVLMAMVMQEGVTYTPPRFILLGQCGPVCYSSGEYSENIGGELSVGPAELELAEGPFTVTMTLSTTDFLLDAIIAVPIEFYNPSSIDNPSMFTASCNDVIFEGAVPTFDDDPFCLQSAVQLSAEFYNKTYACSCNSVGSVNTMCEEYGGQCLCGTPEDGFSPIHGRQCNYCPFLSYLTPDGCADCGCPNPAEDCGLSGSSGQCDCPVFVSGRVCDSCQEGAFGNPTIGCTSCSCNLTGTDYCNNQTGECTCLFGVGGDLCDRCGDIFYGFSPEGCTACNCDSEGSDGLGCDDSGQCTCKTGVEGLTCSQCVDGHYFFSSNGCTPCNCSGQTNDCAQNPNITAGPQEICSCPPPYAGDSCGDCLDGWFLSDVSGNCELCQCNGRSILCLQGSGVCLNCADDTAGDSCEVCLEGYYDSDSDPTSEGVNCQLCPCSTTTSFNTSCYADSAGDPVCYCRPGHEGSLCGSCLEGFFGLPPATRCTQCTCNGNIDPMEPGSCNTTTGECLLCTNNSTGVECEFCAPGFFGDATEQNCKACDCNPDGSESSLCDGTGQCRCLTGVNGQNCEECMPGFWNLQPVVGCELCVCGNGSANNDCNPATGVCQCNEGIGGRDCTECQDSYYNFTVEACTVCECGLGSVNATCSDPDGRCYCQPGVLGLKCDLCAPFHSNLTETGCEPCGECELSLVDQLAEVEDELEAVMNSTEELEALIEAHGRGLEAVDEAYQEVSMMINATESSLEGLEERLDELSRNVEDTEASFEMTESQISDALVFSDQLRRQAQQANTRMQSIYDNVHDVLFLIGDINAYVYPLNDTLTAQAQQATAIAENITAIASQHVGNLSVAVEMAEVVLEEAEDVSRDLDLSLMYVRAQRNQSSDLFDQYEQITSDIGDLEERVEGLVRNHIEVEMDVNQALEIAAELSEIVSQINSIISQSNDSLDGVDSLQAQTYGDLMVAWDYIDTLSNLIGQMAGSGDAVSGSGSGSGSGIGLLEPGSGLEPELPVSDPETIAAGLVTLQSAVRQLESSSNQCAPVFTAAEQHALELEQIGNEIERILNASLEAGSDAVTAIIDYSETLIMIERALNVTMETEEVLMRVTEEVEQLMEEELAAQVSALVVTAQASLDIARELNETSQALMAGIALAELQTATAVNQSQQIWQLASSLEMKVDELRLAAEFTLADVNFDLNEAEMLLGLVFAANNVIEALVPEILAKVSQSNATLDEADMLTTSAQSILEETNATAYAALGAHADRTNLTSLISQQRDANEQQLDSVNASVGSLWRQLELAKQAAASIDIALRFYGNSSLRYQLPPAVTEDSIPSSVSLTFLPSLLTGQMLYTEGADGGTLGLQLSNGSVLFQFDLGGGPALLSTPVGVVSPDQWYQLYATREGTQGYLSVAPLQGGSTHTSTQSSPSPPLSSSSSPLPLSSEAVYLGGRPNATGGSSVVVGGYNGCLDRVVVDHAQLSLLTPEEDGGSTPETCGPRPPSEVPRTFENGTWLHGGGSYLQLPLPSSPSFQVALSFRTLSYEGLLFQVFSDDLVQYISLAIISGRVVLASSLSPLDLTRLESSEVYTDGEWYTVAVEMVGRNISLVISPSSNSNTSESASASVPGFAPESFTPSEDLFFVGGLSTTVQSIIGSYPVSFAGCLGRGFLVNGAQVALADNLNSSRVSFGGCPAEVATGVRFMGEGLAMFTSPSNQLTNVSLGFRSTQLAALLFAAETEVGLFAISLYHTRVRVDLSNVSLISAEGGLNDNIWHQIDVSITANSLTLTVDRDSAATFLPAALSPPPSLLSTMLAVGGTPTPQGHTVSESFRGCMDAVTVDEQNLDFNSAVLLEGIALYDCRPPSSSTPLPPPPPPLPPPPSIRPNVTVGLDGSPRSFIGVSVTEEEIATSSVITLEFQTAAPDLLLLYTQGLAKVHADYMALELRGGRLFYSYNLGSGRVYIQTMGTYDDGYVHMVELHRSAQQGTLVIDDGAEEIAMVSPGSFTELNANSGFLYLGGLPPSMFAGVNNSLLMPGDELPPPALVCFHAISINGDYQDLSSPQASVGAGECLETYTNMATLNGDGYIQILDDFSAGLRFTFYLEFRTTNCSGLLAYVASSLYSDHVVLELNEGTVRFVFDNGPGKVPVEYTPANSSELCDYRWHTLLAEKDGTTGSLTVDHTHTVSQTPADPLLQRFLTVNTNDPLYIGGLPDIVIPRFTVRSGPFAGCLANLEVTSESGETQTLILAQATQSEGTTFHTCQR